MLEFISNETLVPYADTFRVWAQAEGRSTFDIDAMLAAPSEWPSTMGRFRDHVNAIEAPKADDRRSQAEALATMRRREAQAIAERDQARQDRDRLLNQRATFDASHPYWETFWQTAAANADEAGFCPEYDRMAEMMGGIPREREFTVNATVTVSFPVSHVIRANSADDASDIFEGMDFDIYQVRDAIQGLSSWDLGNVDVQVDETEVRY